MIMNNKVYDEATLRELAQQEYDDAERDHLEKIECQKVAIYNDAFLKQIKNSPDAVRIINDMFYFSKEVKNTIHCIEKSNTIESLYVQRNILIETFGRFMTGRIFDFIDRIYNEAINRGKPENEKRIYEYSLSNELMRMLSNISFANQFYNGINDNANLFAEMVRLEMINFFTIQNTNYDIEEVSCHMFNDITSNLLYNVIRFHISVTNSFLELMSYTTVPENQSRLVCKPCQTFISQPYYSEINKNLRNYNAEPLFKFIKMEESAIQE